MTEAEQTAVTFKRLAVTLDVLIERVRRTGAATPLHVLQAAEQLGVEAELRELSDLLIAARHAFVVEGPADEWHVLHPPMCEKISRCVPMSRPTVFAPIARSPVGARTRCVLNPATSAGCTTAQSWSSATR